MTMFADLLRAEAEIPENREDDEYATEWLLQRFGLAPKDQAARTTDRATMDQEAPEERVRRAALNTMGRIMRYILAGGAIAVRDQDLTDIDTAIGTLLAAEGGTVTDLVRALLALRDDVAALVKDQRKAIHAVDDARVKQMYERLMNSRKGQEGSLGGA